MDYVLIFIIIYYLMFYKWLFWSFGWVPLIIASLPMWRTVK